MFLHNASKSLAAALLLAAFAHAPAGAADYLTHADWIDSMVTNTTSANNVYASNGTTIVTWSGVRGATEYRNYSACAPFVSTLVRTAYDMTDAQYRARTGSGSPSSAQYYNLITAGTNFTRIAQVADIQRGDILAMNYLPCAGQSASGHTMVAMGPAVRRTTDTAPIIAGTVQYDIEVGDSTSSPRAAVDAAKRVYTDTRNGVDGAPTSGVGIGTLRLYQDVATGKIAGYTWTVSAYSTYFSVASCRQFAAGRMK